MEQRKTYIQDNEACLFSRTVQALTECEDVTIPLLERLHRLEVIRDKMALASADVLNLNYLLTRQEYCFLQIIMQLMAQSIFYLEYDNLTASEATLVSDFYHHSIAPLLQPRIVKAYEPTSSCIAALLRYQESTYLGIIARPAAIPDFYTFSSEPVRLLSVDSILLHHLDEQFPGYDCVERVFISFHAGACRPILSDPISDQFMQALFPDHAALVFSMSHGSLSEELKKMLSVAQTAALSYPALTINKQEVTNRRPTLLFHPQEKPELMEHFIQDAADDPAVHSIRFFGVLSSDYPRLSADLCHAARRGIQVSVASSFLNEHDFHVLEDAGCRLLHYYPSVCFALITQCKHGKYTTSVIFSTESSHTAHISNTFRLVMYAANSSGILPYLPMPKEWHSQPPAQHQTMQEEFFSLIDEQIRLQHHGFIFLKCRELTNSVLMQKLRDASCAGVQIILIITELCRLLPGVPGDTEHIQVYFASGALEDNTAFICFGAQPCSNIFLLPSDWQNSSAPSAMCPVQQDSAAEKLCDLFCAFFRSSITQMWKMKSDGSYTRTNAEAVVEALQRCCLKKSAARKGDIHHLVLKSKD